MYPQASMNATNGDEPIVHFHFIRDERAWDGESRATFLAYGISTMMLMTCGQ